MCGGGLVCDILKVRNRRVRLGADSALTNRCESECNLDASMTLSIFLLSPLKPKKWHGNKDLEVVCVDTSLSRLACASE